MGADIYDWDRVHGKGSYAAMADAQDKPRSEDLVAFLNARLDEDEAAAKAAASVAGPDWHHDRFWPDDGSSATVMIFSKAGSPLADMLHRDDEEMGPFIASHDPARVLREVEAWRRILAAHPHLVASRGVGCETCHDDDGNLNAAGWCETVRAAAAIWSDHPGYRQEWKP